MTKNKETELERAQRMHELEEEFGLTAEQIEELDSLDLEDLERPDWTRGTHKDFTDSPLWSQVLDGLWQGGTADHDVAVMLRKPMITRSKFDTVITLYADANPVDWFVKEFRYGVWDSNMKDFDAEELFDLVRIAHSEWKRGKQVLIRCQAGWNRSGLVMALVLMREGYAAADAIELIREKRSPWALCNHNFVDFLKRQDARAWQGDRYGVEETAA